ncbi:hypothetical protein CAPTEDRAFT_217643 [Capitella teleta]|uniref:Uncharacterized protein n=1 Tax=Capitella teleta TaxID=283909 RepID=X2AMH5_CAPTE|nr:hypothetical protein CAPTEDRAFT_217643 [Capitella teleta]|eukprot:ELU00260.1 hypothetical protein CAPTEDRAFT_217643 [Capitella teleta]
MGAHIHIHVTILNPVSTSSYRFESEEHYDSLGYESECVDAEKEDTNNYLSEEGIAVRGLSKMSAAQSTGSSYRLEVKASDASQLLHGDFWPEGVRVRRFRRPREGAGAVPEVIDTETTTTSEDGS